MSSTTAAATPAATPTAPHKNIPQLPLREVVALLKPLTSDLTTPLSPATFVHIKSLALTLTSFNPPPPVPLDIIRNIYTKSKHNRDLSKAVNDVITLLLTLTPLHDPNVRILTPNQLLRRCGSPSTPLHSHALSSCLSLLPSSSSTSVANVCLSLTDSILSLPPPSSPSSVCTSPHLHAFTANLRRFPPPSHLQTTLTFSRTLLSSLTQAAYDLEDGLFSCAAFLSSNYGCVEALKACYGTSTAKKFHAESEDFSRIVELLSGVVAAASTGG
eukprot:CAMPEP_0182465560 /NCGR_PEP_ID=MMETSP1319-20130603/10119_1 /TAXON_ID=172717 /ORGANISM="Bolidomonas pacifica, Strain RCC208" /LENGTH=271 /DNA_ID=CAMNT_0024665347 /DNA_START=355 /DNA_END=1167 /DNA_ORIENTATION=+